METATYQQMRSLYINFNRNMFKHAEYEEMLRRLFTGQEFTFAMLPGGFETKTIAQTAGEQASQGIGMRAKKRKQFD